MSSLPLVLSKSNGVVMKYLIVFFGLLLAYTLIYTGLSKFMSGLTVTQISGA